MGAFEIISNEIKGEVLDGHAQRNMKAAQSAEALKNRVLKELGLDGIVELIFKEFPSRGVTIALSTGFKNAKNLDDIERAKKLSKCFVNVNDCSTINQASSIISEARILFDDIEELISISTHQDSSAGELFCQDERDSTFALIKGLDDMQTRLFSFVLARSL